MSATAAADHQTISIGPQSGPQTDFLSCDADVAILGGGAGGGKTWALLMDPLRFASYVPAFSACLFRRTTKQVTAQGGMWDQSIELYAPFATARQTPHLEWRFGHGDNVPATIRFGHLEHETTALDWQGAQLAMIGFDELTHFSEWQFWYLVSRNRSSCGVRPYIRATTNPDADSWVARLLEWWIGDDGYAIPERAGQKRWFKRDGDAVLWFDEPPDEHAKSLAFFPALLSDNPKLTERDPGYEANLLALGTVERERLLKGNWAIRPRAGLYFQRGWIDVVDAVPQNLRIARGWDLAATEARPGTDPDWTCGHKMGVSPDGRYFLLDHVRGRLSPSAVENLVSNTAAQDGHRVMVSIPQDPGQAGKGQVTTYARLLSGYNMRFRPVTGDKVTRFSPFSAQCEAGNVSVLRGPWNETLFRELENFPPEDTGHDDDADAVSEAFEALTRGPAATTVGSWRM